MNLHINDFEGPLDLLLHLVRTAKMNIYDIDTTYIIDKYLDNTSEYLVMASELIHLKSRLLLNLDDETEEDSEYNINSEEDLKNKLLEYEQYKNASMLFKNLEENRSEYYTKIPEAIADFLDDEKLDVERHDPDILANILLESRKELIIYVIF